MVLALEAAYLGFPTSTIPFLMYSPVLLSGFDKLLFEMLVLNLVLIDFLSLKYLLSCLTVMVFLLLVNLDYEDVPSFLSSALLNFFSVSPPFKPLFRSSLYEVISLSIFSLNLCLLGKTKWPPDLLVVLTSELLPTQLLGNDLYSNRSFSQLLKS